MSGSRCRGCGTLALQCDVVIELGTGTRNRARSYFFDNDAEAYNGMGNVFFDRKSYEKALRAYERAVALEADNTAFQLNRSNALKWLGKHQVKNGA